MSAPSTVTRLLLTITSQQDADSIPECISKEVPLNKNLIISPDVSGPIEFKHLSLINGSIYAQDSLGLTSLSLEVSGLDKSKGKFMTL